MNKETAIKLFQDKSIRVEWVEDEEKYYFSIVDVISVLTDSERPRKYWNDLKKKLIEEGSELSEKIGQLKMNAEDGKNRLTDVADTEQILRLIQSIPSPKAEPFKRWLAKVGSERVEETEDPEKAFDRAVETYLKKGYSPAWINQRIKSIEIRKDLTDEWDKHGVKKGMEYAILTDEITKAWSGYSVKEYKNLKRLKKENLRDNMNNLELVLNMLAEATTTEISKQKAPQTYDDNKNIARQGGTIVGNTRKEIEAKTGKSVVTSDNAENIFENTKPPKLDK
jgi:hypothetical protein